MWEKTALLKKKVKMEMKKTQKIMQAAVLPILHHAPNSYENKNLSASIMYKNHSSRNGMRMQLAWWDMDIILRIRERLEQPEVRSETDSVSLSCPELSVKDRNKRAGREREES